MNATFPQQFTKRNYPARTGTPLLSLTPLFVAVALAAAIFPNRPFIIARIPNPFRLRLLRLISSAVTFPAEVAVAIAPMSGSVSRPPSAEDADRTGTCAFLCPSGQDTASLFMGTCVPRGSRTAVDVQSTSVVPPASCVAGKSCTPFQAVACSWQVQDTCDTRCLKLKEWMNL